MVFLDQKLTRMNGSVDITVSHMETTTARYITIDSHSPTQHKVAVFHSMIHRLCKLLLSVENYRKEYEWIVEVAQVNGYKSPLIDAKTIGKNNALEYDVVICAE